MSNKLLTNPVVKSLIRSYLPDMINGLAEGEQALIAYIESHQLEGDETSIVLFTEIDVDPATQQKTAYLVVGAFTDRTFTRMIEAKPAREFLKTVIENYFKK